MLKNLHHVAHDGANVDHLQIGAMDFQCALCGAQNFPGDSINCFQKGTFSLAPLRAFPLATYTLLTAGTEQGQHFHQDIQLCNSALAFSVIFCDCLKSHPSH